VLVGLDLIDYDFAGFFQPIDNLPTLNGVKAGSAVPVKFSLGGNHGLDILNCDPSPRALPCLVIGLGCPPDTKL